MKKIAQSQSLLADITHLIDQLECHCFPLDGSYASKSAHADLQLAVYCESIATVEEYQQAVSAANLAGVRDLQGL